MKSDEKYCAEKTDQYCTILLVWWGEFMSESLPNQEVDVLRGGVEVLMVLGHSFIVYPVNIADVPWCEAMGRFIYTFHMEFLLS